jgi:hypothetical protein
MIATRRIEPSYDPRRERASANAYANAGAHAIRRALVASGAAASPSAGAPLELQRAADTPPHIETATPLEGDRILTRRVDGDPIVGFGAFLDGVQRSTVVAHHGLVPLVIGSVAAAVRERHARRMRTYEQPIAHSALFAPLAALDPAFAAAVQASCDVVDTAADDSGGTRHPAEHTARALTAVQRERERAEQALALRWLSAGRGPLLIDGGISGEATIAKHANAVGVVKSHRTLYATDESLALTLALREGERTTAVAVRSPRRTTVASWYLRLREPGTRGPFFGLVRIEVAADDDASLTERADLVSRWLLAERTPVSLPDARWDVMVYGIRDCEQYLSAILR